MRACIPIAADESFFFAIERDDADCARQVSAARKFAPFIWQQNSDGRCIVISAQVPVVIVTCHQDQLLCDRDLEDPHRVLCLDLILHFAFVLHRKTNSPKIGIHVACGIFPSQAACLPKVAMRSRFPFAGCSQVQTHAKDSWADSASDAACFDRAVTEAEKPSGLQSKMIATPQELPSPTLVFWMGRFHQNDTSN